MKIRHHVAIVAAATGIGSFAGLASLTPGTAAGRPVELIGLVLAGEPFRVAFALAFVLLVGARLRQGRSARAHERGRLEPLLWGAGAPTLSLLLDPWFFHSTVFIVGFVSVFLGALAALARPCPAAGGERTDRRALAAIIAGAVLVPTLLVLPGPPWFHPLSGDEPHYLVTARSLWVDGDVDVSNEYRESLWQPFWSGELSAHAKPGADPDARYPIHGSGLSVWLAPWYGAGSGLSEAAFNVLIRAAMSLWLAAAAAALFLLTRDLAGGPSAVYGTALAIFTVPLLFAGPHLFPAVPVFALSCAAYGILRRSSDPSTAAIAGMLLAPLPWLHFKFFGLMAAVALAGAWWIFVNTEPAWRRVSIAALTAPLVLTGLGHLAFTWRLYERLSPLAIHVGADPELRATAAGDDLVAYLTDPVGAIATGVGYFLDQREGLLFYAPQYLLAAAGFAWLWRRRRRDAIALAFVAAALVVPYAMSQETGHWSPPARPLTGVLWVLAAPMAIGLMLPAGATYGRTRSAVRAVLVAAGIAMTVTTVLQADLLYHDYNVGRSLVLMRYGAPTLPLWGWAPLWLGPEAVQWGPSLVALGVAAALAALLWRWGTDVAGRVSSEELPVAGALAASGVAPATVLTPAAAGTVAATAFVALAASLMFWHHHRVPLTALHQPWTFGTIRVWKPQSPPTRAWATEQGVWTGGNDTVRLLLSSTEPIDSIAFQLETLAPMIAEVQLGRDRQPIRVDPRSPSLARFSPGPGAAWNGEHFYHLEVVARGGISRAALGIDDDTRGLGAFLEVVQVESPPR